MATRMFDQVWSSNGTSGGQSAVKVTGNVTQSVWYFQASTGESTATIYVQSGLTSTGPWFTEAGTTALSSGVLQVYRLSGPFQWVRPFCGSTGITVRAIGVG